MQIIGFIDANLNNVDDTANNYLQLIFVVEINIHNFDMYSNLQKNAGVESTCIVISSAITIIVVKIAVINLYALCTTVMLLMLLTNYCGRYWSA